MNQWIYTFCAATSTLLNSTDFLPSPATSLPLTSETAHLLSLQSRCSWWFRCLSSPPYWADLPPAAVSAGYPTPHPQPTPLAADLSLVRSLWLRIWNHHSLPGCGCSHNLRPSGASGKAISCFIQCFPQSSQVYPENFPFTYWHRSSHLSSAPQTGRKSYFTSEWEEAV